MTITEINEDNIFRYTDLIPAGLLGELSREYCGGLAGDDDENDEPAASIVWEIRGVEDDNVPVEAEILWFEVSDGAEGSELLQAFEDKMRESRVSRVSFELAGTGGPEESLLEAAGFATEKAESRDIYVTVSELCRLKLGTKSIPDYIKSLSEITPREFKTAVMTSVFHGKYGLLDDLPFLPMTRFDPDISSCVITDGKVNGLILVHEVTSGTFIVELLFVMQPDASISLLNMMRYSIRTAGSLCNEDDLVILRRHNPETEKLIKKLFPEKKGASVTRGEKSYDVED